MNYENLNDGRVYNQFNITKIVMDIDSLKAVSAAEKSQLSSELTTVQQRFTDLQSQLQIIRREHDLEKEDSTRRRRLEEDSLRRDFQRELETVTRTLKLQVEETEKKGKERLEEEVRRREREVREFRDREGSERDSLHREIDSKEREIRILKNDVENLRAELEREQGTNRQLRVCPLNSVIDVGYCYGTICSWINARSYNPCVKK